MVLAPLILISLVVVIEHLATGIDTDVIHLQGGEQGGAMPIKIHHIFLDKVAGKDNRLSRRHHRRLEHYVIVVSPCHRYLSRTIGSEASGFATSCVHNIHIKATLAIAGKGNLTAVGTPHWFVIVGRIGGQLACLTSIDINAEDVALIGKCNLATVGRY